jgi:class 3 adenylate cyclase
VSGVPETSYTALGDSYIAYQVTGADGPDLVYVSTATHPIDLLWEDPVVARGLRRLAASNRLILCDLIGVGSSDPILYSDLPAMQTWADGFTAVLDAVGSDQATFFATSESTPPVLLFAATHPERVRSLVLWSPYARYARDDDHPAGMPTGTLERYLTAFADVVGTGGLADFFAPSRAGDEWFRAWWGRGERLSAGHGYIRHILALFLGSDVRAALPSIQAPTLLARRTGDYHVRAGHATAMADTIPDATLVELEGDDHEWFSGDSDAVLEVVEEFLSGSQVAAPSTRALATVMFTDIVASTERATELGDARWSTTLAAHDALVDRYVRSYRGTVLKYTGDGVLATFDGPARAIQCALDLVAAVQDLGLEIRAGLHTGEVETSDGDVHGIAVHIAARVMGLADSGEVLVSSAVPPLVLGSGLEFEDLGLHTLKGISDRWTIFKVDPRPRDDTPAP